MVRAPAHPQMKWNEDICDLFFSEPVCEIPVISHNSTYDLVITALRNRQFQVAAAAAAIPDTAMEDPLQIKVMPPKREMFFLGPKMGGFSTTHSQRSEMSSDQKQPVWWFYIGDKKQLPISIGIIYIGIISSY